jgi:ABC-type transporter Mla subunit MlaD
MVFLPIIANNLGKVAVAAATTLGLVGYVNRERIGRWFADEPDELNQERPQNSTRVLETADKKHAELLDKLALNTAAVTEFKGLIKDVHEELGSMAENFQGEFDAQRSETRALGEELREAVADLARRQDAVEQFLHGKDWGEVFAVPGRQRTAAETPRRQEETGKKPTPNNRRKGNNGSSAPETRAP